MHIKCTNCGREYPDVGAPYRCGVCGAPYDMPVLPAYRTAALQPHLPGIWRYREMFGLGQDAPVVSLGEGNTPLVQGEAFGLPVAFKLEFANPTGSYKDRGAALLVSFLLQRGVREAVEDSSGNAGAAFAAYAARGGLNARVYVPQSASGPKRAQIAVYGAEVVAVPGSRADTARVTLDAAAQGAAYASHAYLPQALAGYATLAYELYEQLGQAPGAVVAPAGQGNLLLAIGRGFQALLAAGLITRLPALVGVQARACAPLWAVFHYGAAGYGWVSEGETLAEGVRVRQPVRGDALLRLVNESGGTMLAVDEEAILPGRDQLARRGLYVEPTSAIVWSALEQALPQLAQPVVAILTGSGLKTSI